MCSWLFCAICLFSLRYVLRFVFLLVFGGVFYSPEGICVCFLYGHIIFDLFANLVLIYFLSGIFVCSISIIFIFILFLHHSFILVLSLRSFDYLFSFLNMFSGFVIFKMVLDNTLKVSIKISLNKIGYVSDLLSSNWISYCCGMYTNRRKSPSGFLYLLQLTTGIIFGCSFLFFTFLDIIPYPWVSYLFSSSGRSEILEHLLSDFCHNDEFSSNQLMSCFKIKLEFENMVSLKFCWVYFALIVVIPFCWSIKFTVISLRTDGIRNNIIN